MVTLVIGVTPSSKEKKKEEEEVFSCVYFITFLPYADMNVKNGLSYNLRVYKQRCDDR